MPYALFLASCSMGSPMYLILFPDPTFPYYFQPLSIPGLQASQASSWGSVACLASQASDWLGTF